MFAFTKLLISWYIKQKSILISRPVGTLSLCGKLSGQLSHSRTWETVSSNSWECHGEQIDIADIVEDLQKKKIKKTHGTFLFLL